MLTRLRLHGFKNLLDVDVRFGPFTCVVGENGVGKSNLFDAIRFLHLLMDVPIPEAVARLRETHGRAIQPEALFTAFGEFKASEIRLVADMVVDRDVEDDFGARSKACISSVRYTVAFVPDADEPGRLALAHEALEPVPSSTARTSLGFPASSDFRTSAVFGKRAGGKAFMSTREGTVHVHQEGRQGRNRHVPIGRTQLPIIQSATAEFPTLLAARREMQSWRTLMLEPSSMRAPSEYTGPRQIDERGGNLAGTLHRLRKKQGLRAESEVANRLAELIPEVREVRVIDDARFQTYTAEVKGPDGVFHPARALSDGTLRFLVLSVLLADPEARGTLCLEEPENGIHPERIPSMVRLLRDLAVDAESGVDEDNPLRQVIVNTHSPLVFGHVETDDVVFVQSIERIEAKNHGRIACVRVPEKSWRARGADPKYDVVRPAKLLSWQQMQFDFDHAAAE